MSESQQQAQQRAHDMQIEQQSHQVAASVAAENQRKKVENPEFLTQLQDADADTDVFDWVEDELGPVLSGSHILGNRDENYELQEFLLDRNKAERFIAEHNPGKLLRQNPKMHALSQGLRGTEEAPDPTDREEFRDPLTPREKRVVRSAYEVVTNRKTLSIDGRGLDAVANATVENRTVTNEEQQSKGLKSKVAGVFR